jgi:uncharacterized membrane protein YeaQ/YmgE (transglycosylase-associated protein family)
LHWTLIVKNIIGTTGKAWKGREDEMVVMNQCYLPAIGGCIGEYCLWKMHMQLFMSNIGIYFQIPKEKKTLSIVLQVFCTLNHF